MKGARALASGMLVLAAICAAPTMSAAQDAGTPTSTTTTTATTPADPAQPVDPGTSPSPAPPSGGPVAGDLSPNNGQAVRDSSRGSVGVPAPGPPNVGGVKAHKAASTSVTMGDFFFSAATVTISVGDTVSWHNSGQAPHTATANDGSFDTGTINAGGSGSHTFNSAGTFSYICTIHPNMHGTVRVLSSSGGGNGGNAGASSSGTSESSAVASPGAAGSSTTLPMTGMAVGALALVGLVLLASGVLVRRADDPKRSWRSLF